MVCLHLSRGQTLFDYSVKNLAFANGLKKEPSDRDLIRWHILSNREK